MLFDQDILMAETLQSPALTVKLIGERKRYNLRLKSGDLSAIKKLSGLKLPSKIGGSTRGKEITWLKLGPDEWIAIAAPIHAKKLETTFAKITKSFVCSITDISHRNIGFEISGEDAAKLINVGCPLDLSDQAFPVGKVTRTVFESAQIMGQLLPMRLGIFGRQRFMQLFVS